MCEDNIRYITSLKEIRVINDPYRREILTTMSLLDKPVTAKEIADYLNEPPSKVNYHVGILHKYDFIDLDHTENINGIIAKFYSLSIREIKIRMEGANSKTKEASAVRDIISSAFDVSRDKHISAVAKSIESKKDTKDELEELIYSKSIYLSNEELEEFKEFLKKTIENKRDKKDRKLYDFFAAYVEINEPSNK